MSDDRAPRRWRNGQYIDEFGNVWVCDGLSWRRMDRGSPDSPFAAYDRAFLKRLGIAPLE